MKQILLFDSDCVLADFANYWVNRYNELYDDDISVEDFNAEWGSPPKVVKPEVGTDVYEIPKEPGFFEKLDPMPGAIEYFEKFCSDSRFDCYIVTAFSGHSEIAKGKMIWFEKVLPFFDAEKVILTKQKQLVHGDVLIDDSIENLIKWDEFQYNLGKDGTTIAFAAPHNEDAVDQGASARVSSWEELWDYVNNLVTV